MKFSSTDNKILTKPSKTSKDLPLIAELPFKDLENAPVSVDITPIACQICSAVLTDITLVKKDPNLGIIFACKFCGTINKLGSMPKKLSGGDDVEYTIEKVESKPAQQGKKTGLSGELVTSIIDISGSMSGSKLEAVKHNLVESIKDMAVNAKTTVFLLITFESSVQIFFSPKESAINITTDELLRSEDNLRTFIEQTCTKFDPQTIDAIAPRWVEQVEGLYTLGSTALGPGLASGIDIFLARKASGRILLLTDGLANVGFGRLEADGLREGKPFYEKMAKTCSNNNIVVDVIGVGGDNDLALDVLGKLSELTGGELFFVSEAELQATFSELSQRQFIGRDVKVRVFTPKDSPLEVGEISGISSAAQKAKNFESINVGSVTPDREAFIQFNVKPGTKAKQFPVQVQVEFKDAAGNKKLRVFKSDMKPVESDDDYKANYDSRLMSVMKIQQAGEMYSKGETGKAHEMLKQTQSIFKQNQGVFQAETNAPAMDFIADEMGKLDDLEKTKKPSAAKSFSASAGQKRSRVSLDKKMKEVEDEK
jgi:Mg-chelatase subunit ChlD